MRVSNIIVCSLLFAACATPVPVRFGAHARPAPAVAFSNPSFPDGDALAGRRAFIDLQCIDCHRVAEDPGLPRGARAIAGPILSGLGRSSAHDVARKITSRDTGANEDLLDRTMKDYAQPITARNLVDLVAYLRSPKLPG
jgi:cytochrome c2